MNDDMAFGCAVASACAFVLIGVLWLLATFWWLFLLGGVAVGVWLYHHPGVRAKRELRAVVRQGDEKRKAIKAATEKAKAEMDRIARAHHVRATASYNRQRRRRHP